ncbi:MAG: hypothetical protein GKR94_00055 [Gammaproteobacteria bacterium]|nr:hypothetical protein [Gammaproteobacteria bacterium]
MTEEGRPQKHPAPDTVGLEQRGTPSLWGIAKRAHACQDPRFQNFYRLLDAKLLLGGWDEPNKQAARVEGRVTAVAYEQAPIAPIQGWV